MNNIDQKIQAALGRDTAGESLLGEPNIAEEVLIAFRGRNRWLTVLTVMLNLGFFAGVVWAAVRFYHADTIPAQIQWGALGLVFLLLMMSLKLWFWMEMHTNRVLRELKRVELLLITRPPSP